MPPVRSDIISSLGYTRSVRSLPPRWEFPPVFEAEIKTHLVRDRHSNLIKSAALFFCLGPCCLFVPVCFLSRMFLMEKRGNKRSSSSSFLLLPSKEIISACEMTSRKTAWNCLFFPLHISLQPWAWDGFQGDKMASDILPHTEQTMDQSCFKPVPPATVTIWMV